MTLSYPVPTRISPPDSLRKYRFTVNQLPDTIIDFGTVSDFPEEIWSESGFKGAWAEHSTRNGTTFDLACWNKPWNWDGTGIGFWNVPDQQNGPISSGSFSLGVLAPSLNNTAGTTDRQVTFATGYHVDNDGGGGLFIWDAESTAPVNNGTVFGPPGTGRWLRQWDDMPYVLHSRHFGLRGNQTDETAAIQNFVNQAGYNNTKLKFAPGNYHVTDTIYIDGGHGRPRNAVTIESEVYSGNNAYDGNTVFWWDSASTTKPLFWAKGFDHSFNGISVKPAANRHLLAGIVLTTFPSASGPEAGFPVFSSQMRVDGCVFGNDNQGTSKTVQYGVAIGGTTELGYGGVNLENCEISNSQFAGCRKAGVHFHGGQAINSVIRRCNFIGWSNPENTFQKGGAGISNDSSSTTCQIYDTDFQSIGQWVHAIYPFMCAITGGESEHSRAAIWDASGAWDSYSYGYKIENMRVITDCLSHASADGICPAGTHDFIRVYSGCPLELNNMLFTADYGIAGSNIPYNAETGDAAFSIGLNIGTKIVSRNCVYPNTNPFGFYENGWELLAKGGVESIADKAGQDSSSNNLVRAYKPMPRRQGSIWNTSGTATITGTARFVNVPFPQDEYDGLYSIELTLLDSSNAAAVGTVWASDMHRAGFALNTSVAPGAGKSVMYQWHVVRNGNLTRSHLSLDPVIKTGAGIVWKVKGSRVDGANITRFSSIPRNLFGQGYAQTNTGHYGYLVESAELAGQPAMKLEGYPYSAGYIGSVGFHAYPMTLMVVCNNIGNGTVLATTLSGHADTGTRIWFDGEYVRASRLTSGVGDVVQSFAFGACVIVVSISVEECRMWVNSITPAVNDQPIGSSDTASTSAVSSGTLAIGFAGSVLSVPSLYSPLANSDPRRSYFNGEISEISAWNKILTQQQVEEIMLHRLKEYEIQV